MQHKIQFFVTLIHKNTDILLNYLTDSPQTCKDAQHKNVNFVGLQL